MADIPLFPDESNMARFQDFVNIQKEISEHLLTQKHLYADIGRINRDVEDRLIKRRARELDMLNLIQKQNIKYNELVTKRGTLSGQAAKDLENDIDATLQLIEHNRKLVDLSKLASSIEVEMAKKQYEEGNRWYKFASEEGKKILGIDLKQFEAVKATGDKMLALGGVTEKMAYSVGAVIMMLTGAFNLFKKLDTAAWNFRKAMGMTRLESAVIRKDAQRIAIDNMAIGVTIESALKSYQALGQVVGGVHNVSKSLAEDVSIMSAQLGISEEKSAQFLRNMAAVSKSTLESQTAMMYIAKDMSNAAGVQLDQVMGDIATRSNKTLTLMSRMPNVALRTAIELRRMGTDLDHAASSSRHILDFTENVNEEMEASVLLGRSINLQRARELAYRRDLEGSTKEILRITKSVNFENLDVFQQEAFARATGRSVEELLKMLQTSKQLERVKRSGTPEQKAQLALYEKMRKENEAAARARAKDVSAELRRMGNQERLVQIQNKWNALLAKAQEFLLPVIDHVLGFVLNNMELLVVAGAAFYMWGKKLLGPFNWLAEKIFFMGMKKNWKWAETLGDWMAKIAMRFGNLSTKVTGLLNRMGIFGRMLGSLSGFFGGMLRILGTVGRVVFKVLAPIFFAWNIFKEIKKILNDPVLMGTKGFFAFEGKIILRALGAIGRALWTTMDDLFMGLPNMLMKGLGSLAGAILGTLSKPFKDFWTWLGKWFLGNSPSKLGLMIWKGIVSVGGMIYEALVTPYKMAFQIVTKVAEWASKTMWKGISQIGPSIVKGIVNIGTSIFDALTGPFRRGWNWIKKNIPGVDWGVRKLSGGGMPKPVIPKSVEKRATAAYIPAATVSPSGTKIETDKHDKVKKDGKKGKEDALPMSEETGKQIVALLEKILHKDSNIKMDGQLLSTHLARQTEFRGGYGVNKVA